MGIKRWLLLIGLGFLALIAFILLAFGEELLLLFSIIGDQLNTFFRLSPEQYGVRIVAEIVLFIAGVVFIIIGIRKLWGFFSKALIPEKKGKIANLIYKQSVLQKAPRVVVIGGGTGLNSILSGLKNYTNNITAIVSVSDEGGSSRRLRTDFGMLPPGDMRNCLVALSDSGPLMEKLLEYRFKEGKGLKGHSFGNLLITALSKVTGSFDKAITETGNILAIRGKVLPVTLEPTHLCAELENGKIITEEPEVEKHKTKYKSEIRMLFLKPRNVKPFRGALKAIKKADYIVLGPGSLYTSILPNLLVKGVPEAIKKSKAKTVYVCNVMTQPGETDNYTASMHVEKIIQYLGKGVLNYVVVNTERAPEKLFKKYQKMGAKRVKYYKHEMKRFKAKVIETKLLTKKNLLRHDPNKLAKAVLYIRKR
jgi:uncharacterized cofD-like protein